MGLAAGVSLRRSGRHLAPPQPAAVPARCCCCCCCWPRPAAVLPASGGGVKAGGGGVAGVLRALVLSSSVGCASERWVQREKCCVMQILLNALLHVSLLELISHVQVSLCSCFLLGSRFCCPRFLVSWEQLCCYCILFCM